MPSLFNWGGRKDDAPSSKPAVTPEVATDVATSKVLPRLLGGLKHVQAPVLMDLGPVVGSNIAFFGEQLACKIFVEDLFAVVEAQARAGTPEAVGEALVGRLNRTDGSVDGILCWDLFDYLDKNSAKLVAARLVTLLKPGGYLYAFFGSLAGDVSHYSRFIVESPTTMRLKPTPATRTTRRIYVVRDIDRMFEGLSVTESVLLKSRSRETLFKKPA